MARNYFCSGTLACWKMVPDRTFWHLWQLPVPTRWFSRFRATRLLSQCGALRRARTADGFQVADQVQAGASCKASRTAGK